MTHWLKWRLGALFGCSALLIGASILHAQSDYPAPPKTPEEAGEQFFALLNEGEKASENPTNPTFDWTRAEKYLGCISRNQAIALSEGALPNGPEKLFALLAQEANESQFTGKVTAQEGDKTIVEVAPVPHPTKRAVVTVAEDGGYRVDLFATYGRWNELSGEALSKELYHYTTILSASNASGGGFLNIQNRNNCQSNLKQLMLGNLMYAQDYDERFPRARAWQEITMPYIKSSQLYTCPSVPKDRHNGYAYNQYLSQITMAKLDDVANTIHLYETSNLNDNVFGPGTGRAFRHQQGWNIAFSDGHIKWFSQEHAADSPLKWKP